ncbi:hypothetical protein HGRIS_009072 [Hohenbuehelia grisea]|uniref:HD/PDEase domain-containing protein n=1 Tax=Hohenbuehelia grisea TaxID=104357 RepID=A0ABR3J1F5_9AGAR
MDRPRLKKQAIRIVKDSVHELISWSPKLSEFIDTRQFQRLRAIKQLGTSYYVWPGASHNRFEHCIGVAHLARQMATHLKTIQPELGITDRDIACVELAGLCHDLGHGPWSHVWDGMFIPTAIPGSTWTHEQGSEEMLDWLVADNKIDIPDDDLRFIKAMIAGEPSKCGSDEKIFLFHIVSNKLNGLDVDKFDYIRRDQVMVGDQGNISLNRLIQSARVIDNQICYDAKDSNLIYELYYTRFRLHKMIYNHKTAKAVEYMIIDALLKADPVLHIASRVEDVKKFLHLTDDIMPRIEADDNPALAPAQEIFARIRKRDLYKCVDFKNIQWDHHGAFKAAVTADRIVEEVKRRKDEILASVMQGDPGTPLLGGASAGDEVDPMIPSSQRDEDDAMRSEPDMTGLLDSFSAEHVIVDFSPMHYGMKEKNPLDFVKFYSNMNPTVCHSIGFGNSSMLMPAVFGEVLMRVYVRQSQYYGLAQAGFRAITEQVYVTVSTPPSRGLTLDHTALSEAPTAVEPPTEPGSPAADRFSTPGAHSRKPSYATLNASPGSVAGASKTPLGHNPFTSVHPSFAPHSPSAKPKRKGSEPSLLNLRARGDSDDQVATKPGGEEAGAAVQVGGLAAAAEIPEKGAAGQALADTTEVQRAGEAMDTGLDPEPSTPKGKGKGQKRGRGQKGGSGNGGGGEAADEEVTPKRRKSARRI